MPRANLNQTSFTGGVLSPRVLGRVDIERYFQALKSALNAYAVPQGGLVRRPGSLMVSAAHSNTADASILVPFIVGRDTAFMCEFADGVIRIFSQAGALVQTISGSGYASAMLRDLDYAQADKTLWVFHPLRAPARLQLLGSGTWVFGSAPFTTVPFAEVGYYDTTTITLSLATVGVGRTATASGPTFLAADVGRGLIFDAGIAVITAVASATSATVEITRAFASVTLPASQWDMEGSPQTTVTPSANGPVGASITLTAAANAWRARDVGAMVRINGGLCRITAVGSATSATAFVLRELAGVVAAPALSWSLEHAAWNDRYGWPRTGTIFQQRLIVAGTTKFPRTVWGSRIGEPLDFELGTTDDLAFSFTIDSDESSPISYITSSPDLLVLTESGEYSMRGGVEKPITPTNVRVRPETAHGSARVRPVFVGSETLFVQRAGKKVRALAYRYDADRYTAPDITSLSEHLSQAGVTCMAWQQEPDPVLWAGLADGTFLSCTLDRDQQPSVIGWFPHATDGFLEWLAVMPVSGRDELWALVRRGAARYIERFDPTIVARHSSDVASGEVNPVYGMTVDCGAVFTNGAGQATFSVPHLANRLVDVVADGFVMPAQTVGGDGSITLSRTAKQVQIGLHFNSRGTLLTPEMTSQTGTAQGSAHRTGNVFFRFLDTLGAKIVNDEGEAQQIPFQQFGGALLDQSPRPYTGFQQISTLGWSRGSSEFTVQQDLPLPMHLLSVTRRHTANEG
jgi:hypothetical protein